MTDNRRVGVLMGGLSSEREVSFKSGRAVAGALRERGWDVVEIDVGRDLPAQLLQHGVEVAWIALHGRFGEDGCVQGLCEVMGIPYTGSGVRASAVCMDKIATKRALAGVEGVVMARDQVVASADDELTLQLPVVVKPPMGGSSVGLSLARTPEALTEALALAFRYHHEVLLEEYVEGEEITVAVLDGRALPVVRILPESGFFDFAAKYTKGLTRYEVPAQISEIAWERAQSAALRSWEVLGCAGLVRADFIVREADQQPVLLEVNTLPGMTATSLCPMAAGLEGMSFAELAEALIHSAHCMEPEPR